MGTKTKTKTKTRKVTDRLEFTRGKVTETVDSYIIGNVTYPKSAVRRLAKQGVIATLGSGITEIEDEPKPAPVIVNDQLKNFIRG